MAVLAIRAHFEVTGGIAYLLKKLKNFYNNKITYEQTDESLLRLTVGYRDPELEKKTRIIKRDRHKIAAKDL